MPFLRIFLALWLAITPAFAWAGSCCLLGVFNPTSAPSFSLTYMSSATASGGPTVDYGTLTYGSGCTRVIVANLWIPSTSFTITGVTIGGSSLTQVSGAYVNSNTLIAADIWETTSSLAGSSGDVQVTYSHALGYNSSVAVYCLVTTTPTASSAANNNNLNGTTVNQSITVPSGGGAIAITGGANGHSATFSNATVDAALTPGGNNAYYGHTTSTGSVSVTATYGVTDVLVLSLAAWGP